MEIHETHVSEAIEFSPKATGDDYLVRGTMTFSTASLGLKLASVLLTNNRRSIRFDLAGIVRADSAGVGLLIEWLRIAHVAGCQLRFLNIPESLQAMIRVGGVEGMLPVDA